MSARNILGVSLKASQLGFKQALSDRLPLLGSFLMYAVILLTYSSVFYWIPAETLSAYSLTTASLICYLGITELVAFCAPTTFYKELQQDILSDQIHLELLRPCPMWTVKIGHCFGQYVARFIIFIIPSYALLFWMTKGHTPHAAAWLGVILSLPFAGLIMIASSFIIGASCLWLKQAEPLFWVWQKGLFLLGGLLWPLILYPKLLAQWVWLTPFPSVLAVPAQWTLSGGSSAIGFLHQIFWGLAMLFLVVKVNAAILRRIQQEGA